MQRFILLFTAAVLSASSVRGAEPSPLGKSLKDIEVAEHWIYDDLPQAIDAAKSTGKPLLVVLRCVPCPPGRTLDEQVMRPTGELEQLEKQFVCVRLIQTKGLNLDVFQYDYDMSWNAMFMNADQTIYGRYGTRYTNGHDSDQCLSVAAFANAARRALALHQNYPANKDALAGKTGNPVKWKVPEDTPGLTDRKGVVTEKKTCIHCHMVKEFALREKWLKEGLTESDIYLFPAPKQIGLELDQDDGLLITAVADGSPAAAAGLKAGDALTTAAGQPLVSTADLTWVLHTAANETTLPIAVRRGEQTVGTKLVLSGDWKKSDIAWRVSSWHYLRHGMKLNPLPPSDPRRTALPADAQGALEVHGMWGKGVEPLQKAGLKKGDVIVAVDGRAVPEGESDFFVNLRTKHGPGDTVKFTVVRDGKTQELTIPLW